VAGLIVTYDHRDAGDGPRRDRSHIGCGASYTKKGKSGLRQKRKY
jgi:hypothetical protein